MSEMMQSLESRVLFSTTTSTLAADMAAIKSAEVATSANLASVHAAEGSLHARITADVKASQTKGQVASNKRLYASTTSAELIGYASILAAEKAYFSAVNIRTAAANALGKLLLAKPTNTALRAKVAAAVAASNSVAASKLATLNAVVTNQFAKIDAQYAKVGAANPSAAADITSGEATVATATSTFTASAATVVTAVTQLGTDLAAI